MQYVIMAVVGAIVGFLAKVLFNIMTHGGVHLGLIKAIIFGIAGSYLAGFVGNLIHKRDDGGFHPAGFLYSIGGALALIFVAHNLLHLV